MRYLLILNLLYLTALAKPVGNVIVEIPEASGIGYCSNSDTLTVANDEGAYYEISPKGKILQKTKLGNYDLEGVVCEDKQLIFAIENKGILVVERKRIKKEKITLDTQYNGKELDLFHKKSGVEGIAKENNRIYLSKQSNKKKKSFIAVVEFASSSRIIDVIEHRIPDTAGLTFHDGYLYMVSDKEDLLVQYDIKKRKKVHEVKLGKGAWEGIAFDDKGIVYLADDDGKVLKYKKKSLGL